MKKVNMWIFLALFVFFLKPVKTDAQVVINELMASNVSIYPDMCDFEDFPDWIELYNSSNSSVDLTGYYLSDNLDEPKKWAIPSGTKINAKSYLIILADGYDAKPGQSFTRDFYPWTVKFTTKRYHTNFKLSSDGDEIVFSKNSSGGVEIVDSVSFPAQFSDISYGRNPSLYNMWFQYDQPTPGAANTTDAKTSGVFSGSVTFSVPGGYYSSAQTVTLTANGDIYYTLDGSIPNKNSNKYYSPLSVSKTTTIRARCIEPEKYIGKTATNTYLINEKQRTLLSVSVTTDTSWLYNKDIGVFENSWKGREVPVTMEFFNTDGKQIIKVNAGMRLGSLTNFECPQKPLQVALKGGKYGDDFIWNQLFNKDFACFSGLRLRQGGDAWNSNLISDGLLEGIVKNQMELGAQAYRPVILFINGKYYGIQDLREQFDDQYFTNNYNADPSTKDEVRTILVPPDGKEGWELVSGSWDSWQAIVDFAKKESMSDNAKYEQLKSQININSLIDFVAIQEFGANVSWGHNEDIWKVAGSKWQWLVTDFDRCFSYSNTYGDVKTDILGKGGRGLSKSLTAQDTLFGKLLNNSNFKSYFVQRFAAHLNSTFKSSRLNAFIDSLAGILTPEMDEYVSKWKSEGGIKSVSAWNTSVDSLKRFMEERGTYVFEHLSSSKFADAGTAELTITLSDPDAGEIYINQVSMSQGLSGMAFFKSIPLQIKAVAKPGYVFAGWGEGESADSIIITMTENKTIQAKFEKAQDHPVASKITVNTTLNLTDHPYVTEGDITVAKGVTLTIEKGVTFLMPQDADIDIDGRLLINGTSDAPVKIKTNKTAGATNWGAINFNSAADTCKLYYVEISGTTLGDDALNERAGINGNNSNVVMDHITMTDVIYPFYFEKGSTVLRNSSITIDHICNGGIHIGRGGAIVENNYWVSTGKTINTDAIDIKGVENGIIRGNKLYNFNGFNSDGIDLGEGAKNILVEGNFIFGNRDKGISCGGASTCTVRNNIIVACDLGIGIKDENSKAELDHNTFVRNRIAVAVYTKVFGRGGGTANVKNCILAASKGASFYTDEFSSITMSYCISDKDILPGTGNLFGDPKFTDILKNNFQLTETSPCINTGDPSSSRDKDGTVADIGAQYTFNKDDFPSPVAAPYYRNVVINEIMADDSKDNKSGDWIEIYNPTDQPINIGNWKIAENSDFDYWENIVDITTMDSSKFYTIAANTVLSAHGYLVICKDLTLFKAEFPQVKNCVGNMPFGLDKKETVLLFNDRDSLVNLVSYSDKKPWGDPPNGTSYELISSSYFNYAPLNWGVSNGKGSPGNKNTITAVFRGRDAMIPNRFYLAQNYPNPFRNLTTIKFALPVSQQVNISVYTINGRLLETVINERLLAGIHKISWNARAYSPGIYFYKFKSGSFVQTKKFTIQ